MINQVNPLPRFCKFEAKSRPNKGGRGVLKRAIFLPFYIAICQKSWGAVFCPRDSNPGEFEGGNIKNPPYLILPK